MPSIEALGLDREMWTFYQEYYTTAATSPAYAEFCEQLFGRNYLQHGFADMQAVDFLIQAGELDAGHRILELGCGAGGIATHLALASGAHVTGIDFAEEAIRQAQTLLPSAPDRLCFAVADIGALDYAAGSFTTVIAIDTLYFTDLDPTLARIKTLLTANGQLLAYWSQGADPLVPIERFDRSTLPPTHTDLGQALHRQGFTFETWDFTAADVRHAHRKRAILTTLAAAFAVEGRLPLFENRMGEAEGVLAAFAAGCHARYLYRALPL